MPNTESGKIRNVAVIGHRGTGKTSLVEALLVRVRDDEPPRHRGRALDRL